MRSFFIKTPFAFQIKYEVGKTKGIVYFLHKKTIFKLIFIPSCLIETTKFNVVWKTCLFPGYSIHALQIIQQLRHDIIDSTTINIIVINMSCELVLLYNSQIIP